MKVDDLFELPENVVRIEGRRGKIRSEDETRIIAKYEVIKIKGEFKGRILMTYGNKRESNNFG